MFKYNSYAKNGTFMCIDIDIGQSNTFVLRPNWFMNRWSVPTNLLYLMIHNSFDTYAKKPHTTK